jgi:hypothetical protein
MRIASLFLALALAAPAAWAEPGVQEEEELREKDFGVGLAVGVASGPNLQFMPTGATQINVGFGVGSMTSTRFQTDFAFRVAHFTRNASLTVPFYIGAGAYFTDRRWGIDAGVRVPLGVQAEFARLPIQIFGEVTPEIAALQTVSDDVMEPARDPRMWFTVRGMLGVRATF